MIKKISEGSGTIQIDTEIDTEILLLDEILCPSLQWPVQPVHLRRGSDDRSKIEAVSMALGRAKRRRLWTVKEAVVLICMITPTYDHQSILLGFPRFGPAGFKRGGFHVAQAAAGQGR